MDRLRIGLNKNKRWFAEIPKGFKGVCAICKTKISEDGGFYYCHEHNLISCDSCSSNSFNFCMFKIFNDHEHYYIDHTTKTGEEK
tara:strand:- start:78 stop:332 length:255 start_codon:yes stop_codon:yes gene_type:complete